MKNVPGNKILYWDHWVDLKITSALEIHNGVPISIYFYQTQPYSTIVTLNGYENQI